MYIVVYAIELKTIGPFIGPCCKGCIFLFFQLHIHRQKDENNKINHLQIVLQQNFDHTLLFLQNTINRPQHNYK